MCTEEAVIKVTENVWIEKTRWYGYKVYLTVHPHFFTFERNLSLEEARTVADSLAKAIQRLRGLV